MSSPAAARAEARRKAILARGSDRLNKLTTSARGQDAPAYMHDDPPLPSLSRASMTPEVETPPRRTTKTSDAPAIDPSVWSEAQQKQFMSAFMGVPPSTNSDSSSPSPSHGSGTPAPPPPPQLTFDGLDEASDAPPAYDPNADPMQALMAALGGGGAGGPGMGGPFPGMPGMDGANPLAAFMQAQGGPQQPSTPPKPKSRFQRLLPLFHIMSVFTLVAYFVLWQEPAAYVGFTGDNGMRDGGRWRRWTNLISSSPESQGFAVQLVPFFWAFVTLQLGLHSMRFFYGLDKVNPHPLLALALPYLPAPFPSLIRNGLSYLQLGSLFLDDVSALIVGIGAVVWLSSWVNPAPMWFDTLKAVIPPAENIVSTVVENVEAIATGIVGEGGEALNAAGIVADSVI